MTNYEDLLTQVIDRGIKAASESYKDSPNKLKGSVDGFNACRGLAPQALVALLQQARTRANHSMNFEEPIDLYWELRCYEAEVEWVCNCVSVALMNEGLPTIVPPTARATILVAEIVGVGGDLRLAYDARGALSPYVPLQVTHLVEVFYIIYKFPLLTGDKVHEAGPYATREEARSHYADIFGYEGVEQIEIVGRYPPSTKSYNGEDMIG